MTVNLCLGSINSYQCLAGYLKEKELKTMACVSRSFRDLAEATRKERMALANKLIPIALDDWIQLYWTAKDRKSIPLKLTDSQRERVFKAIYDECVALMSTKFRLNELRAEYALSVQDYEERWENYSGKFMHTVMSPIYYRLSELRRKFEEERHYVARGRKNS